MNNGRGMGNTATDIDNYVFRTYNGWVKKGRRVLKGETAMLVSNTLDVPIYLFSKGQTTKVKSMDDYGPGYGDCSGYDDYGYDDYGYDG